MNRNEEKELLKSKVIDFVDDNLITTRFKAIEIMCLIEQSYKSDNNAYNGENKSSDGNQNS